ncbi:PhoX family protein [Oceanospirillum sediminis]|uniref:PhoX family phosphatase n=1 Tax=Oceanospirillum sediminis TaxID=2760088 RepID=A0A839IT88_9GAMM|nr:PhoX family phosphatase [Oceanospirillum sediminis]MBB1488161.1 PhoX family phosphatase [Oceanospirillum sediminis]
MADKQWDADEDKRTSPSKHPGLNDILQHLSTDNPDDDRLRDRLLSGDKKKKKKRRKDFAFAGLPQGVDGTHHVAKGYRADILIRWGDPVTHDAPDFDPDNQCAWAQARQFGYNNDFVGFMPLPRESMNPDCGLLAVNHEYTSRKLMFPEHSRKKGKKADYEKELCEIEMAAHGMSVIEIEKDRKGRWQIVRFSPYNRRISPLTTTIDISGPAAGHERMKTGYDPKGRHVIGTLNNCAGGVTPWGTVLTAEENFNGYFWGAKKDHPEKAKLKRYGVPGKWFEWGKHFSRFNIEKEPYEPNRFGWLVEVDPYDPYARPVKRTALGRFKHEGAAIVLNVDDRVVIYSADDQSGEYLYKFVSDDKFDATDRRGNFSLLDKGTLYVARFEQSGAVSWLPLVYGQGVLTEENGFNSQADVVIDARLAADKLGATALDRPEDVIINQKNGAVYVILLGESGHSDDALDGRILEITVSKHDHAAVESAWDILLHTDGINPAEDSNTGTDDGAAATSAHSGMQEDWLIAPDNGAVDNQGRLWVTTDQGENWGQSGSADGIWAVETRGKHRGAARMFFRVPVGAEMASPTFTPDDKTMFISVQHPGSDGSKQYPDFARESTFSDPLTRWPDFRSDTPPRPSLVVISKKDGGVVGS